MFSHASRYLLSRVLTHARPPFSFLWGAANTGTRSYAFWSRSKTRHFSHSHARNKTKKHQASTTDLPALAASLADREAAVRGGLNLDGTRFEVHRHYPPLVYGRAMDAGLAPEDAEGVALCAAGGQWGSGGDKSGTGAVFGVVTYALPHVSAKMVPKLQAFMEGVAVAGGGQR